MIGRHRLSAAEFSALASGLGGAGSVRTLRRAQLSKHLLLVKFILDSWPGARAERDAVVSVLSEAQARAPEAVADLLGDPLIGAWAAQTVRRIRGSPQSPMVHCGHLAAVAAVAAVRSGLDADLAVYARQGRVVLPQLGSVAVPAAEAATVSVTVCGGVLAVSGGEDWREPYRLSAEMRGRSLAVRLDDLDPYRGGHHAPAADRLPADQVDAWRQVFARGWDLLTRHAAPRADEVGAGLQALVPLADLDPGAARSATIRDAFGVFGLTLPPSAVAFASTLVHEFQHSKLSAILDLVPLHDGSARQTYYAPWRTDPRPVGGLVQGVYAFLGVADLWRSLRAHPGLGALAEQEFADIREQVHIALAGLEESDELTPAGQGFTAGMRSTVDDMMAEPLPGGVLRRAREALRQNQDAWQRRNNVLA